MQHVPARAVVCLAVELLVAGHAPHVGSNVVFFFQNLLRFQHFEHDGAAAEQLRPELLQAACEQAKIPLTLRRQPGYDHSYYFISTFMADHLRWHAERLKR